MKLVLVRHGESLWNKENKFTGWTDVELSENGIKEAREAGKLLHNNGFDFDFCYTSYLKRAIHTLNYILDEMDLNYLDVEKSWKLNERHYGALQGENKSEMAKKVGEEQVFLWRRSFDTRPPLLKRDDKRSPFLQRQYQFVDKDSRADLPLGESLKDTIKRAVPYYQENILKDMISGKRVIIVAHGNSLRALVKYIEKLTDEEIKDVNIPTGIPLVYELDEKGNFLSKQYLVSDEKLHDKMTKVANQGKA